VRLKPGIRLVLITTAAFSIFLTFFCGIYRHDIPARGYYQLGRQKAFACVGKVWQVGNKGFLGSCVLIDSKHVLTATHVIVFSKYRSDTIRKGNQVIIKQKPVDPHVGMPAELTVEFEGKHYGLKSVKAYLSDIDSVNRHQGDLTIIELSEAVPDVSPAVINGKFDELHANVVGVGYGVSGVAFPADSVKPRGEKIGGENMIDTIGGMNLKGQGTLLTADFDHPSNPQLSRYGNAAPLPLEYSVGGGDSGGGLFRKTKSGWELVGICAGTEIELESLLKNGYYGDLMYWTRISVFYNWINQNR
jgi:hypothetical protein